MESSAAEAAAELSEGELPEEEENGDVGVGEDDGVEPDRKKRKLQGKVSSRDDGEWQTLSKKQQKKMKNRAMKEKKRYQEKEDKFASALQQPTGTSLLNTRQTEVLEALVKIFRGEQSAITSIQKIKTLLFQQVVSHLVVGSSMPVFHIEGLEEMRQDHRVVVVWLSMVSAEFFRSDPQHFPRMKKLTPCVWFDLEHPGSSTYARLGLEIFMMSGDADKQSSPSADGNHGVGKAPSRWSYLFSLSNLTDHDFPNPSNGAVDQLGRNVGDYFSVREWPDCDIRATAEVSDAKRRMGKEEDGATMPMFAIDCEMVETQNGSELARISIVNEGMTCVYDSYVKPDCPVIDYRSKYSGIFESTLDSVTTTLKNVQEKLADTLPPSSILIGHSLENDFHAMKFRHPFVIDTSCLFTPQATPTYKPGLRKLSKELLITDIQNSDSGHDSIEDATTCMKLVLLKLKEGNSCKVPFNEITPSIFTNYRTKGYTTGIVDKESVIRLFGKGSSHSVDVKTDAEAAERSVEIIPSSKFTFVQLHSMEYLLKSESQATNEKQLETADNLDKLVMDVVKGCPSKTIFFVACGSSDIRKVRSLQQQDFTDYHQLKKQVLVARTGCVVGFLVN